MTTTLILSGVIGLLLLVNGFLLVNRRRLLNGAADSILELTEIINSGINPDNLRSIIAIRAFKRAFKRKAKAQMKENYALQDLQQRIADLENRTNSSKDEDILPTGPTPVTYAVAGPAVAPPNAPVTAGVGAYKDTPAS